MPLRPRYGWATARETLRAPLYPIASKLRRKERVARAISAGIAEKSGATPARVVEALAQLAFTDVSDVLEYRDDGQLYIKPHSTLTRDQLATIQSMEEHVNEAGYRTIKVRQYDRLAALKALTACLGMRRSPSEAGPAVTVNVNTIAADGSTRVWARIDELVQRREAAALPQPTEQPMQIELQPIKEIEHVEA
jgi:hypothetical protein